MRFRTYRNSTDKSSKKENMNKMNYRYLPLGVITLVLSLTLPLLRMKIADAMLTEATVKKDIFIAAAQSPCSQKDKFRVASVTSEDFPQPGQKHRSSGNFSTQDIPAGRYNKLCWEITGTAEPGKITFNVKRCKYGKVYLLSASVQLLHLLVHIHLWLSFHSRYWD